MPFLPSRIVGPFNTCSSTRKMSVDLVTSSLFTDVRSGTAFRLLHLVGMTLVGVLSVVIVGLRAGTAGSRVALGIIAVGGDSIQGRRMANGNLVGDITVDGTVEILTFGGLFPGVFGGLICVSVQRWHREAAHTISDGTVLLSPRWHSQN